MSTREPLLSLVPITSLRPTQITLGLREVEQKRQAWRGREGEEAGRFLGDHMIPVIWGPKDRYYIIDHHHLCLALHDEGVKNILVNVVADLRRLPKASFWVFMDGHGWCHPYDEDGKRRDYDDIPTGVAKMRDDPFRSLAGELRRAGGFSKDATPFSEFLWADFLRRKVKVGRIRDNFDAALAQALQLAKLKDADYLPGWCGPSGSP
jgi:hypothetical protein